MTKLLSSSFDFSVYTFFRSSYLMSFANIIIFKGWIHSRFTLATDRAPWEWQFAPSERNAALLKNVK
jgi:hypothetical protein